MEIRGAIEIKHFLGVLFWMSLHKGTIIRIPVKGIDFFESIGHRISIIDSPIPTCVRPSSHIGERHISPKNGFCHDDSA